MFGIGRAIERVNAFEQGPPKRDCAVSMTPCAENEMDFYVDRPRNEDSPTERRQKTGGELVTSPLGTVACRDQRTTVTDDQPARRESTSSTRRERSGSSTMMPA